MPTIEELKKTRIRKLESLKAFQDPYPNNAEKNALIGAVVNKFWVWQLTKKKVAVAGRIKNARIHGRAAFLDLEDDSGKIQCFLDSKNLGKNVYDQFLANFDVGDFAAIAGSVFKTKKNEKTIRAESLEMLSKALRPLPEKWHGLKDVEERYRKRYLDLLMNSEVKNRFLIRSKIVVELRNFFDNRGFIEFETPMLHLVPGGASAQPFQTHLNALNLDLYLRIAKELYLKRLIIGGFDKIYEIGRDFRNEGMDAHHNPEFTMLEFYIAYKNADYLKTFFEDILRTLVGKLNNGRLTIHYENKEINFSKPFEEKKYNDLIGEFGDLDIAKKNIVQPTFVVDYPRETLPLAKTKKDNPEKADAFQIFIGGFELVKAFSEQNNPLEQRKMFEEQEKLRQKGDMEAQRIDEDFLEALEYGMPPCAGAGLGIDRLAALLTNSHTLREIILFPTMKPRE